MTVKYYIDEAGTKKIVLKEGRVSCSCCEEPECCMYPATAFAEDIYTADDLPNEVTIAGVLAYKQGDGFPRYLSNDGDFYINDPSEDTPPEDATWNVTIFGQSQYVLDCLISSYEGSSPQGVEDQFADTYTVSGPISGTVTRESICVWRGTNLRLTNYGYQWKVNGNDKSGNQNTPVGSYAGGYTVS